MDQESLESKNQGKIDLPYSEYRWIKADTWRSERQT